MIHTKKIAIDLARPYVNDNILLHEGDVNGSALNIDVYNNGEAFDLTGFTVEYDATIAGYLAEMDAAASTSENTITVPVKETMTAYSGLLKIDVKICKNSEVLFFRTIEANVQKRIITDSMPTPTGEKVVDLLKRLIAGLDDKPSMPCVQLTGNNIYPNVNDAVEGNVVYRVFNSRGGPDGWLIFCGSKYFVDVPVSQFYASRTGEIKYRSGTANNGTVTWDTEWKEISSEGDKGVTPQSYGAVGDGVHDDTAAFQNAVNAAAQEKDPLYLKGTFKLTDTVTIPQHSVIVGDGKNSAVVTTTAKTAFVHDPEDIASGETPALKSCVIRNIQFVSAYQTDSSDSSDLGGVLFGSQIRGTVIQNCTARAYARVFAEEITNLSRIENNSFTEIREYLTKAVVDSSISKNYISASRTTFGKTIAFRSGLYNTVIDGNYIDFWTAVFVTKDGAVSSISNNVFDNCYTVFFQRASMLTITGNTFSNIHYVEKNWKSGSTYFVPAEYRENWAVFRFNSSSDPLTTALIPLDDGEATSKRYSSLNRLTFTGNVLAGVASGTALVDFLIHIQSGSTIQGPVFSVVIDGNEINPDTGCDFKCSYSGLSVNLKGMFIQPLERAVYDTLPNASLTKNPVQTYDGHQILYQNRLMTNINGTWYTSALESDIPSVPTKVSELTNDAGYLTQHQDISGKVDKVEGKELSTNDYTTAEKNKLGGIETGATKTVIDSALSSTSTNPVQNKVIQKALNDLPAVPTKVSELTNDSGYLTLGSLPIYNGGVQ